MSRLKLFALNILLFFVLLAAPYIVVAKNYGLLFDSANFLVFAGLAAAAVLLAAITSVNLSSHVTAIAAGCLLFLFVDFITGFFDTLVIPEGSETVSTTGSLILAALATGTIALVWLLRNHLQTFLITALGAVVLSTVALAVIDQISTTDPGQTKTASSAKKSEKLPVYIHLVLDEQQGLSGFNDGDGAHKAIKADLGAFFTGHNFKVFSRAYSQYFRTVESVPAMLHFASVDQVGTLIEQAPEGEFNKLGAIRFTVAKNAYFDQLLQQGYRLHVYQTNWLGFCKPYAKHIAKCATHTYTINHDALQNMAMTDRAQLLIRLFVSQSLILKSALKGLGVNAQWTGLLGPKISLPAFDALVRDVSKAKNGDMFFAHLFMPHYPYSLDAQCRMRRPLVSSWLEISNHHGREEPLIFNTEQSRRARYNLYIPQVRCVMTQLEKLFAVLKERGLYDKAIIVINGDHGSRIVLNKPLMENKAILKPQDFHDGFSSLFAVKMPGVAAGIDRTMMTVPQLMKRTAAGKDALTQTLPDDANPQVYLHTKASEPVRGKMTAVPFPALP